MRSPRRNKTRSERKASALATPNGSGGASAITSPSRVLQAAITGKTPEGNQIKGDYKFTDEFPMAKGFEENAEFFTLTYEAPVSVSHDRAFARIAPLLWMRAGSTGRRIEEVPEQGWDVADTYGLITDLDQATAFSAAIEAKGNIRIAFIVTDDDRRFQSVARRLPNIIEPIRLYRILSNKFPLLIGTIKHEIYTQRLSN